MSYIFIVNIVILNILVWLVLSYFWSYWTFKLFKPWQWLEGRKTKETDSNVIKLERKFKDKNRFYSIWFQLNKIERQQIKGSIAELGVYKGETAKVMHEILPNRKMYLFDSFSGFPKQVIKADCDGNERPYTINFSNTSKEEVLKYIGDTNNIEVREGIFPETATGLEDEVFSFVHLDADLYQSTIDGLNFFYQRLSEGGVILVHDYNHNWEGVKQAIDEFEATVPEQFVELNDMYGSVLLIKNKK